MMISFPVYSEKRSLAPALAVIIFTAQRATNCSIRPVYFLNCSVSNRLQLNRIQQKDAEKQRIANNKNINLIVIPDLVSTESRVQEAFVEISKIIRSLKG